MIRLCFFRSQAIGEHRKSTPNRIFVNKTLGKNRVPQLSVAIFSKRLRVRKNLYKRPKCAKSFGVFQIKDAVEPDVTFGGRECTICVECASVLRNMKKSLCLLFATALWFSAIDASGQSASASQPSSAAPNLEAVSLSYDALREIAKTANDKLKPSLVNYRGIVIYHEPDFLALARYRLYRDQVIQALENYETVVKGIEAKSSVRTEVKPRSLRAAGSAQTSQGLNIPGLSLIKSAAELIALFRTEQTITQSVGVIDKEALGTVMAGIFLRSYPNATVYHPQQFVPEYAYGKDDEASLYTLLVRTNVAEAFLNYFLDEMEDLKKEERDEPSLKRMVAAAKVVQAQIKALSLYGKPITPSAGGATQTRENRDEFREMIRAEKLDRFFASADAGKIAVVKLRLLSSGGSKRESRNLILGNKTDYSGSVVIEVALYDADGKFRVSEVFSHHTGFRKLKTVAEPKP